MLNKLSASNKTIHLEPNVDNLSQFKKEVTPRLQLTLRRVVVKHTHFNV